MQYQCTELVIATVSFGDKMRRLDLCGMYLRPCCITWRFSSAKRANGSVDLIFAPNLRAKIDPEDDQVREVHNNLQVNVIQA